MKTIVFIALVLACAFAAKSASQTAIQSTGPADALLDHLKEIQTDIRLEQAEHNRLYNEQHQECEDEFTARTAAIVDGEDALARAVAHHARCEAAQLQAEADLAQTKAYQSEINGILVSLQSKRQLQKANYNTFVNDELTPAIKSIQGAYPILDSYSTGNAEFAEVASHMGSSFKSLVKAGKGASMAAPLAALAQLSDEFDEHALKQVRDLFQKLEQDLVQARADASELEQKRQQVYDETVAEYNTILGNLSQTEANLVQYVSDMSACVVQEQGIIDQASSKVNNNREALKYALQMCNAFEDEYTNATDGRNAELQLLEKLTEFVVEQAELFGDYGPETSGVFESYQSEYEKQLEQQVEQFVQVRAQKNKDHLERMKIALKSF